MTKLIPRSLGACIIVSVLLLGCSPSGKLVSTITTPKKDTHHHPAVAGTNSQNKNKTTGNYNTAATTKEANKNTNTKNTGKFTDKEPQGITAAEMESNCLNENNARTIRSGNSTITYIPMETCVDNDERRKINPAEANVLSIKYAGIMGVPPQYVTNYPLYHFIDEWYGVDYRLGGNDKTGIDCSAFVQRLYTAVFNVNILRTALEQFNNCNTVRNTGKLKEGDLVFFHIHSKHITHVGIYLMNNYFVHASSSQGVVISNLDDAYWDRYFAGGGKVPHDNG